MLLGGINHVAILTSDSDRLCAFYQEMFGAQIDGQLPLPEGRLTFIKVGPTSELNIFEIEGNTEAQRQTPSFGRGRIDHMGLQAESLESFNTIRRRLMDSGATDGFVTDFGAVLSVFFRDPDGLECEVCVTNPDAEPGVFNPPGTPAAGYRVGE